MKNEENIETEWNREELEWRESNQRDDADIFKNYELRWKTEKTTRIWHKVMSQILWMSKVRSGLVFLNSEIPNLAKTVSVLN